ncbi:hypothetical protein GUJ93_ZPchr0012g18977 [Zizania palustris]|uniref:Uncharacterized protein n=1 Tax=Zizania palustris TaxID=103762 RepID=A0A8J5WTA0_ZIZPA|nr:hypothetical protein GUJ93_ZPchr0012g18977 [Zizania palustris]
MSLDNFFAAQLICKSLRACLYNLDPLSTKIVRVRSRRTNSKPVNASGARDEIKRTAHCVFSSVELKLTRRSSGL